MSPIAFDGIPSSIRKPGKYFEFNAKAAVRTLPANKQKVLIIGQRLSSGTVAQKVPTQVFSDKEAETYFGEGSMCELMVAAAIKANPYIDLTVVALDDAGAGVLATGTVTITGPATSSGVVTVFVGNQKIEVAVANADTATAIAAAIVAQAVKQPDLPVIAANAAGVVTFTAKNKGLCGNQIGLGYLKTNATGVGVAVVAMASGATNPAIQDALTAVFAAQYDIIITPYNNQTDLTTLKTHLDSVTGPLEQRPGIGVYAVNAVLSDATTLAGQVNSGLITGAYLRYTTCQRRSMPYEIAAAYGAVLASEEDPARPLNTLALSGMAASDISERLSRTEQESLLNNGVTPLDVDTDGTVRIVRAISTYTKNASSIDDPTYLDITTIRTLNYVRKALRERIALRFPREKLSSKTAAMVKTELYAALLQLEELQIVECVADNKDGLIVERDTVDVNRLNAQIPTDIVNGLHVFAGKIDLLL